MHGRSTIGGNFGRGSWSDIGKFRSKLPRELIVGRRGEEGEEDRRSFLYEEDLTWCSMFAGLIAMHENVLWILSLWEMQILLLG